MSISVKDWLKQNVPPELYFGTSYLRYDKYIRGKGICYYYNYTFTDSVDQAIHFALRFRDNEKMLDTELLNLASSMPEVFRSVTCSLLLKIAVTNPRHFRLKEDYGRNRTFVLRHGAKIPIQDISIEMELRPRLNS